MNNILSLIISHTDNSITRHHIAYFFATIICNLHTYLLHINTILMKDAKDKYESGTP